MQARHTYFADTFNTLEMGARFELRAIAGVHAGQTIAAAPAPIAPQADSVAATNPDAIDSNGGTASETDAAVGAAILGNIRNKEGAAAADGADLVTVIDGISADGTLSNTEWSTIQALGVADGASADEMAAVRAAAAEAAKVDAANFQTSQESTDPDKALSFQDLYQRIQGSDVDQSQRAATELTRRYAAGMEWRGDIDIQIQLEARKLQTATTDDEKSQAQSAIKQLQGQQQGVDASLMNIRTALKSSTAHGGALNGIRLNELRGADNTIDSSAEAEYAQRHAGAEGGALPQGLVITEDGKLAAVVPKGGSIWKTVEQFPTEDGKFDTTLYNELVKNYGEGVNPGDQLVLSQAATDRIRQSVSLHQSNTSAAQDGGATVALQHQIASDPTVGLHTGQLNAAVQKAIDAPGELKFRGQAVADNADGKSAAALNTYIAQQAGLNQDVPLAIDTALQQVAIEGAPAGADTVAKEQLRRDLYAAYGLDTSKLARGGSDPLTQAITDFMDSADNQDWVIDQDTGQDSHKLIDAGMVENIAVQLERDLGVAPDRTKVADYVNQHFFTREEGAPAKSQHEDVQRKQLTDALVSALAAR